MGSTDKDLKFKELKTEVKKAIAQIEKAMVTQGTRSKTIELNNTEFPMYTICELKDRLTQFTAKGNNSAERIFRIIPITLLAADDFWMNLQDRIADYYFSE